jgi:hypothetical protein
MFVLVDRLRWLLNDAEQRQRPLADRYKTKLKRGLQIWATKTSEVIVLRVFRDEGVPPSPQELRTLVKAIGKVEDREPAYIISTLPVKEVGGHLVYYLVYGYEDSVLMKSAGSRFLFVARHEDYL